MELTPTEATPGAVSRQATLVSPAIACSGDPGVPTHPRSATSAAPTGISHAATPAP